MTEEDRIWDKLVKVLDRFKEQVEPLVVRLRQLGQSGGGPVGKDPEREKKNLYMREWMRKKRERERAEKAKAEVE